MPLPMAAGVFVRLKREISTLPRGRVRGHIRCDKNTPMQGA